MSKIITFTIFAICLMFYSTPVLAQPTCTINEIKICYLDGACNCQERVIALNDTPLNETNSCYDEDDDGVCE